MVNNKNKAASKLSKEYTESQEQLENGLMNNVKSSNRKFELVPNDCQIKDYTFTEIEEIASSIKNTKPSNDNINNRKEDKKLSDDKIIIEMQSSSKENDSNKESKNSKKAEEKCLKRIQTLKDFNAKKCFFSPSVVNKIMTKDQNEGYFNYLKALLCCISEIRSNYELKLKAVKKLLNVHTYCKLIISQYNTTSDTSALLEQGI